jgi:hypothetical protein
MVSDENMLYVHSHTGMNKMTRTLEANPLSEGQTQYQRLGPGLYLQKCWKPRAFSLDGHSYSTV